MQTILFGDYLINGGQLPDEFNDELFSEIDLDIPALFTGKYVNREIGYETPELFYTKLCTRAGIVFPRYKEKFDTLRFITILDAAETETKDGSYDRESETKYGRTNKYSRYSNPYASTPADDASLTGHDESKDGGKDNFFERVTQNQMRTQKSGWNSQTALAVYEQIENDKANIVEDFLNEFENCFLQVF